MLAALAQIWTAITGVIRALDTIYSLILLVVGVIGSIWKYFRDKDAAEPGVALNTQKYVIGAMLPPVLYNSFLFVQKQVIDATISYIETLPQVVVQLTGFGAWMSQQTNLLQCMDIIVAALATRMILDTVYRR